MYFWLPPDFGAPPPPPGYALAEACFITSEASKSTFCKVNHLLQLLNSPELR